MALSFGVKGNRVTILFVIILFGSLSVMFYVYNSSTLTRYIQTGIVVGAAFADQHNLLSSPSWTRLRDEAAATEEPLVDSLYPIILIWSGFYIKKSNQWPIKEGLMDCGVYKCTLSSNKQLYQYSTVLLFHHRNANWVKDVTALRRDGRLSNPRHIYVVYNRESSLWEPKGKKDLDAVNGLVNWTMGLRRDNDIFIPTAKIMKGRHLGGYDPKRNYLKEKKGFVAALLTSNCWKGGYEGRRDFIKALKNAGLEFDTYGNCGTSCGDYESCAKRLKEYKFVLAFENSLCDDYISEKPFANGLGIGSVPIIATLANVTDPNVLPPGSFIDALNFSSPYELVTYLQKVGSNPKLYNKYFEWRNKWTYKMVSVNEGHVMFSDDYFCPLCVKIHEYLRNPYTKTIHNYTEWYEQEKCRKFPTYKRS